MLMRAPESVERRVSFHDAIVRFLREHPGGVPPCVLAAQFLKLKNAQGPLAAAAVAGILASDRRCFSDASGAWHATAAETNEGTGALSSLPWAALFCVTDPAVRRILYCALWEILPSPSRLHAGWLVDPSGLAPEDRALLLSDAEESFDAAAARRLPERIAREAGGRISIFLSSSTRSLLAAVCNRAGAWFPDDTVAAGSLLRAAGLHSPRSLSLSSLEKAVFGAERQGAAAHRQGARYAAALAELLGMLCRRGIETRADLDRRDQEEMAPLFAGKTFSFADLLTLPAKPGVYGFKDRGGSYLYIGKANNLKRRLLGYWGNTGESPRKIDELRRRSHGLVTSVHGSELECLLREYRLIKRYAPPLNTRIDIDERNGTFRAVHDCIVLLPHAEPGKGMSVWLRENQKILLKSFTAGFENRDALVTELRTFFFSPGLPAAPTDFPEQEIATRWIRRHEGALAIVPVHRMADAGQVFDAMKLAWEELCEEGRTGETCRRNGL